MERYASVGSIRGEFQFVAGVNGAEHWTGQSVDDQDPDATPVLLTD